ncbi:MAG: hypothetical protein M4D80_24990 [Myxococcota bacterium]|nr:hypothetical protein [Deltaproteobacteria bacterium]MDQ3338436.1 hypothetical protein [Myxococcota bacterium]
MIKLCGVAIDARMQVRTRDPQALARATRWIAANYLATRHYRPLHLVRVASLVDLLSAIACAPVLVERSALPARWQLALRMLGVPLFDRPAGASVLSLAPLGDGTYRVRIVEPHMLAA